MKSLAVLFFGMLLWTQTSLARHAEISFFTKRGEPFQVVLNGRLINRYATDQLRLPAIPGGFHVAEIRLPDRFGALVHRARIYVEPGFKTEYLIQVVGRRQKVMVSKVRQYPLPVAVRPLPAPYRPRHDNDYRDEGRYDNDRYEDRNHDRHENDRYENDRFEDRGDGRYDDSYNDRGHGETGRQVMSETEVDRLIKAIAARPFEDDKMSLARQVLGQSTVYAGDLKRVLEGFHFDKQKLELAKQFYPNIYDQRNFYVVYDAFRFDADRRELERYVSSLPR
jgi:hypothetical protein